MDYFLLILKEPNAVSTSNVLEDNLFLFKNRKPRGGKINLYTAPVRQIKVERKGKSPLILVTNRIEESAEIIAELYKARWSIELFFKWIKQKLKIKKFLGKSENSVKIQLLSAITTYVLLGLFKIKNRIKIPLYRTVVRFRGNDKNSSSKGQKAIRRINPARTSQNNQSDHYNYAGLYLH